MTENDGNISAETNTSHEQVASKGSRCNPHISLYISTAALILAGYSVFISTSTHDNSAIQSQIVTLDNKIAGISDRLNVLSSEVQSNRENLVQTKLKKALENIRDIRELAEEGAKATISEVESMLQNLTDIGERLKTQEQTETPPANEVIRTLQNTTTADEAAAIGPIDSKTDDANGRDDNTNNNSPDKTQSESSSSESILSELLNAASTAAPETMQQDTNRPNSETAGSDIQNNKAEVKMPPAAVPSGPQAF